MTDLDSARLGTDDGMSIGDGEPDVIAAAGRIAAHTVRTPLLSLPGPDRVLLKAEHLQLGGSFKTRGAANAILERAGITEVVTGSSGNHGIALARLGAQLGIGVTVLMAAGALAEKADAIRRLGARIISVDGGVAKREWQAREHASRTGAMFVPSADHPLVVAGAGTVGLEPLADLPELETIFVPTGGGGLLAGVCRAAEQLSHPVRIVGVEPECGRRYAESLAAGRPIELPPPHTVADGLRGQRPGVVPLPIIRRRVDELIGVSDAEIEAAMNLLNELGMAAEPSGSVALAGVLQARTTGAVAILSGGNTAARCATIGIG